MTTEKQVRETVESTVSEIIEDLGRETDHNLLIERIDEECDAMFGELVQYGLITDYNVDDLVSTAGDCATIINVAKADAWVEDDNGLWEGCTYGILASIAYFSLRNLINAEYDRRIVKLNQEDDAE